MIRLLLQLTIAAAFIITLRSSPAAAQSTSDDEDPTAPKRYFYKKLPYGSQSIYSPMFVLLNRGFDVLQLRPLNRNLTQVRVTDARNVAENLADPFNSIRDSSQGGWGTFLKTEVFPLSYTQHTARWVPNYSLHLIGGGQSYAMMREWFLDNEAPAPAATAFSIMTLFTAAFVNESLENKGVVGYNTDALADIYVFDVAGVILFSFEGIRKLMSTTFILSDWSWQPALTFPHGDLWNTGNYYALKFPLPFYERLRLFAYGGFSTLGGLSYKLDRQYSLSLAGGVRVGNFENGGGHRAVENVVGFEKSGAIFLDRKDSLLVSVQVSDVFDYFITANVYPNAFFMTDPGVGAFTILGQDGKWIAGVSYTRSFGLGFGLSTR